MGRKSNDKSLFTIYPLQPPIFSQTVRRALQQYLHAYGLSQVDCGAARKVKQKTLGQAMPVCCIPFQFAICILDHLFAVLLVEISLRINKY